MSVSIEALTEIVDDGQKFKTQIANILTQNPKSRAELVRLAAQSYGQGQLMLGIRILETMIQLNQGSVSIGLYLLSLYFKSGFLKRYRMVCQGLLKQIPDDPRLLAAWAKYLSFDPASDRKTVHAGFKQIAAHMPTYKPLWSKQMPGITTKKIRIGFLSAYFHGMNTKAVFPYIDTDRFEIFVYTRKLSHTVPEPFKLRLFKATDTAADIATCIARDAVHILVDMGGPFPWEWAPYQALSYKPAPVIINWVITVASLQAPFIDHIFSDPVTVSESEYADYSEKIVQLPQWLSFTYPTWLPEVSEYPMKRNGWVTFGSSNMRFKMNNDVYDLWAKILKAVPKSRMILKNEGLQDPMIQTEVIREFNTRGISQSQLILEGPSPHPDYFEFFSRVDIALDTFPFTGNITTMETLNMGVPVVTLKGDTICSRYSASWLNRIGCEDLICATKSDYQTVAVGLAKDPDKLGQFRTTIRDKIRESGVVDGVGFTRSLEAAWEQLYERIESGP